MLADRFDPRYFERDVLFRYHAGWAGLTTDRPTPATYRDRSGVIRTAGPGVLRLDWRDGRPYALVEPEATNLIPGHRQKFEGWQAFQGAVVTVTQGQTIAPTATAPGSPEGAATRIQTSGGTHVVKYLFDVGRASEGEVVSISVLLHNQGAHPAVITPNTPSVSETVQPGQTRRVEVTFVHPEGLNKQIHIRATDPAHDLDFIAWAPQIELTPYVTSPILDPTASSPDPTVRGRDLVSTDYAHPPGSCAVYEAGIEAGTSSIVNARAWQIGAGWSPDWRSVQVMHWSSYPGLYTLLAGNGVAAVRSQVPVPPLGAEYQRLALLDIQGTQARVRLLQRYRETPGSGPWIDASGSWSTWLDVSELLALGWESPHLTIGNVREGSRAGRMLLSDMLVLDGREISVSALTWDRVREWLP